LNIYKNIKYLYVLEIKRMSLICITCIDEKEKPNVGMNKGKREGRRREKGKDGFSSKYNCSIDTIEHLDVVIHRDAYLGFVNSKM